MFRTLHFLEKTEYVQFNLYIPLAFFKFEANKNCRNVDIDTQPIPINGAFSLIKNMTVKSAGKFVYKAVDINQVSI